MKSIVTIFSRSILTLCFSSILIFGGMTVYFMISDYQDELQETETEIMGSVENSLKKEVSRMQAYIKFSRDTARAASLKSIKTSILEAHSLAMNIYETYKGTMPEDELKQLIKTTLQAMIHEYDDSYLFIIGMDGVLELHTEAPDITGNNVLGTRTSDSRYILKEMISLAERRGEGYIDYLWTKPGDSKVPYEKTSYIKLFTPYQWILGTGNYRDTITRHTQELILKRLNKLNSGGDEYFAGTFGGISLLGKNKGKSIMELKSSDGVYIVQEFIKAAKSGGKFITYRSPSISSGFKTYKKTSYCEAVPGWNWVMGASINIDQLEDTLQQKTEQLWNTLLLQLTAVLALIFLHSLLVLIFAERFKRVLAENFSSFENFFRKGTDSTLKIDRSRIDFTEFDKMAELANTMIDSRETAKSELLKSEITYREIFNATKDAIGVLDINKKVFIDVNQTFLDFFGMERAEAVGMGPEIISFNSPPYDGKYAAELFNKALSGESVHFEWMVKKKTGEPFWTDNLARVASIGGQKKLLIVMRNITERRKMQKLMVQTEKMMSIGGLAAGMAHEINNPLGIIMQVTQNIIRRTSPTLKSNLPVAEKCNIDLDNLRNYMDKRGINEYLSSIQEAGTRAAAIVKSMLEFSRKSNSSKSSGNIEPVIETALSLAANDYDFKKKYDFKKINIIRDFNSSPMFNFTEMEISQVILSLIKNAAQALMEEKNEHKIPTITIRTSSDENFVRVEIEDNGPGIDQKELERIFEPFYSTKDPGVGTGLGLSVSYYIITQNHGGTITADSNPGEGTRFTIILPILT
ncbi:cache domain-containing protein [Desulfovibrio sp. JC022]|uniref:cache domain-containing protein n=1 Tax=Desulfovibrio sp. JC022 TaxID=2593642 RepID=UPI0013D51A7A|nr:cache domain-containing protein [Desulfovibrio sp. JC022]NDV21168.1 PAS domain S-box protein [Desulfovibrio sp. JC022]